MIARGNLALGGPDPKLDSERQPIDTVVIHHTSQPPGLKLARLNVIHLLNLYVRYYAEPRVSGEEYLQDRPISSNHFDSSGQMIFYAYHWLVRIDSSAERLLSDGAIGWHAGDWDINCRSVAICLDNDYAEIEPNAKSYRLQKLSTSIMLKPSCLATPILLPLFAPANLFLNGSQS